MDHDTFIGIVEQEIRADRAQAEQAAHAALQTLGERIDREEARDLAAQLPPEDAPWIASMTPAERFDAEEFVRRVAEREGVEVGTAWLHAAAVLDAVSRAVDGDEWDDMVAELPSDFAPLLPRGPDVDVVDVDTFVAQVAGYAGLDAAAARRASEAVLETLAERIAGGEVDDLAARLPLALRPVLERGKAATGGNARPMKLERFIHLIAEREGVGDLLAASHARAVLRALRDAVGDEEYLDVTVQLPPDYDRVIP